MSEELEQPDIEEQAGDAPQKKKRRKKGKGRIHTLLARPTLTKDFAECIELGCTLKISADYVGISERIVQYWIAEGQGLCDLANDDESGGFEEKLKPEQTAVLQFFREIKRALAQSVRDRILQIKAAGSANWQAAAWYLERRYPADYGKRDTQIVVGQGSGEVSAADADKIIRDAFARLGVDCLQWGTDKRHGDDGGAQGEAADQHRRSGESPVKPT